MVRDARFWRNVGIVGAFHLVALLALAAWSGRIRKPAPSRIVWMDGAAVVAAMNLAQVPSAAAAPPEPDATATPQEVIPEETPPPVPEATLPPVAPPAEIALATPRPTETPTAAPKATPRRTPAREKVSPKADAKSEPTEKPVPKKKKTRARTSPTPAAKARKSSQKTEKKKEAKKVSVEPTASPEDARSKKEGGAKADSKKSGAGGASGSGRGDSAQFSWYASMLHDRFNSAWEQPTSVVATGVRMSALVRIRIEQDGRVSSFEIVKRSGNVVVDESVAAVAKRVTRVDPLPAGLSPGSPYEVRINFELNSEP